MRAFISVLLSVALLASCAALGEPVSAPASPFVPTDPPTLAPTPPPPQPTEAAATPTPAPSPTPARAPAPTQATPSPTPTAQREPFSLNLYAEGDFVSQYTKYHCLPAAMQVMINIIADGPADTTRETQDRLYELARTFLIPPYVGDKGAQPEGWAEGLNVEGVGPYVVAVRPTRDEAIRLAASQMRLAGKPVGLLAWRGAHAWVMSGFEADADPLLFDDFVLSGVYIEDVWWPRVSSIWGESNPPNTLVPIEDLGIDFLKYRRPRESHPDKDGQFVLILPLLPGQEGVRPVAPPAE